MPMITWDSVVNNWQTNQVGDVTAGSPTNGELYTVVSTSGAPASGYLDVDAGDGTKYERIAYASIEDGTHFRLAASGARGADGTTAREHSGGATVGINMGAAQVNELRAMFNATTGHQHSGSLDDAPPVMTPDTVPTSFTVPAGYSCVYPNLHVPSDKTVVAIGTLIVLA